ncbi:hypothetical protein QTP86_030463, partial [Hemibagrus guttatus]
CVCAAYLGNTWHQDALREDGKQRQCHALGNVLLGNLGSCHPCGCYFDMYHLPRHCCRPCTPFHVNGILWIHGGPTSQLTGIKGSVANILVPDTTANLQGSSGDHALTGLGCFGSKIPPPTTPNAPTPPPSPEKSSVQGNPERSEEHGEATRGGSKEQGEASGGSEEQGEVGDRSEEHGEVSGRSEEQGEASGGSDGHGGKARGSQTTSTAEPMRRAMSTAEQEGRATSTTEQQSRAMSTAEQHPPPSSRAERHPLTRSRAERRPQPDWAETPRREGGREVWPAISSADEE